MTKRLDQGPWFSFDNEDTFVEAFISEGWVATFRVEEQDGRPVVAELRVYYPAGKELPRGGLTRLVLGSVRLSNLRHAFESVRSLRRKTRTGHRPVIEGVEEAIRSLRARGRYARSAEQRATRLDEVATLYREALKQSVPTAALIAERLYIQESYARKLIAQARREGVLRPSPGPRRKGEVADKPKAARRKKR